MGLPSCRIMDRIYFLNTIILLEKIGVIFHLIRIFFEALVRLTFDSLYLGIFDSSSFFRLCGMNYNWG